MLWYYDTQIGSKFSLLCVITLLYLYFYRLGQSVQTNNEDLEEGVSCRQGSLSGRCLIKAWLFKLISDDFIFS